MQDSEDILNDIRNDSYIRNLWEIYVGENKYIGDLEFDSTLEVLALLSERISI